MQLIDQHTKKIMEGCKERARDFGLRFQDETLEYIVTNRDLLELSPKVMIPTLYDYWVHDVEVLKEKGKYELYPSNPYETVINTRPPISFYNDNNPDWLNVMIFYHVLGHIDFFQNNIFFRHTWDYDFNGQALSDKRLIARLRTEKGRFVDYVIEFARGLDNIVGFFKELSRFHQPTAGGFSKRIDYYFDVFLQQHLQVKVNEYIKEVELFNQSRANFGAAGEDAFFVEVDRRFPEFEALFRKHLEQISKPTNDILQYLLEHSEFLGKEANKWMKMVIHVVRNTSLFFQPQIRTKIMNEGWASYWHEKLFFQDDRIKGHEIEFARVNAGVTAMPRVGLNPYALGMRLFEFIRELADKGRYSLEFRKLRDSRARDGFDSGRGDGDGFIFQIRENLCDFSFVNTFVDQDFINKNKLFVAGRRLDQARMVWQYYVKSRKAEDYRRMIMDMLYHPPLITVKEGGATNGDLDLVHHFEGKPLVRDFIANTMLGLEYLWGRPVNLETNEPAPETQMKELPYSPTRVTPSPTKEAAEEDVKWERVLYTMKDRKLTRKTL
ncbi:MAG: SpoVR family protein [Pseudomonadota bacterium]